jgi:hypothetical protein
MRLLNSQTSELEEFVSSIPPYAILSHTWGEDEVSLQELQSGSAESKAGYEKIEGCCKLASADGFQYAWIDTCCIDKTSSSELSEAINSMFRWYRNAEVCYVILSDVSGNTDGSQTRQFDRSRWFTRGWTLQELIAPSNVIFLNNDWEEIGTKISLQASITKITGIPKDVLLSDKLEGCSIAQRMSWASKRRTTRVEDIAYCLMGIFGVNMAMLYGEGDKAFFRLQEEIMKISDDHTIFAWKTDYWGAFSGGLLADSPAAFRESGNIVSSANHHDGSFSSTNRGLRLELPLIPQISRPFAFIALLACHQADDEKRLLGFDCKEVPGTKNHFLRITKEKLFAVERDVLECDASTIEHKIIYVQQMYIPKRLTQSLNTYIEIAPDLQDRRITLAESIPEIEFSTKKGKVIRGFRNGVAVMRFDNGAGQRFDVGLGGPAKFLLAKVITPLEKESLEDVFNSLKPPRTRELSTYDQNIRGRNWENWSDRIVWKGPEGIGNISIVVRKQMVSVEKRFVVRLSDV